MRCNAKSRFREEAYREFLVFSTLSELDSVNFYTDQLWKYNLIERSGLKRAL